MTGYQSKRAAAQDKLAQPAPNQAGSVFTTPPQRTWVYLTDEHIKEIVGPYGDMPIKGYTRKLIDQIEAKSKEINNG